MTSLKGGGDKYADQLDITRKVFLNGPHNLGPVIEARQVTSGNVSPGLGMIHATGVGGEDDYTEHGANEPRSYAVSELDINQIADCDATYAQYDDVPGLPYHMNGGAYLTNINCSDPVGTDVDADDPLTTAAVGAFILAKESVLESSNTGTTEAYAAAAVTGANGTAGNTQFSRVCLRQAYFLTDPNAVYQTVAYIARGD